MAVNFQNPNPRFTSFIDEVCLETVRRRGPVSDYDRESLDEARRPLQDGEMRKYTVSYAAHHFHACLDALESFRFEGERIEVFDWGCGPATATAALIHSLAEKRSSATLERVILIDPSTAALDRAGLVLDHLVGSRLGREEINAPMGEVDADLLYTEPDTLAVHLFNYVLDIPEVNIELLSRVLARAHRGRRAAFLSVSPNYSPCQNQLKSFHARIKRFASESSEAPPSWGQTRGWQYSTSRDCFTDYPFWYCSGALACKFKSDWDRIRLMAEPRTIPRRNSHGRRAYLA